MDGIFRVYCDHVIRTLVEAWQQLMEATAAETLHKVRYGKTDTLGLDAITEITIQESMSRFDTQAILITEESDDQSHRHWPTDSDPDRQPLMFFCDPTDRSNQLEQFFKEISQNDLTAKIGDLLKREDSLKRWEKMFEPPAVITGPNTAIACIHHGRAVFSVVLNYLCGTIFVASDAGISFLRLKSYDDPSNKKLNLAVIYRRGKKLYFPGTQEFGHTPDQCRRFVTYLGKTGYAENLRDSLLFLDAPETHVHHQTPPGPSRLLYLSELQKDHGPIGFVLANGEKIGEWMPWLAFIKYGRDQDNNHALRAFEVSPERPWIKNGMLMSTSPAYSIFGLNGHGLRISHLQTFDRPSQFRCMLVVVRYDNERIIHVLQRLKCREVTDCF